MSELKYDKKLIEQLKEIASLSTHSSRDLLTVYNEMYSADEIIEKLQRDKKRLKEKLLWRGHHRHYLYIIGEEISCFFEQHYSGFIKVGVTGDPKNRLKALQNSNPRPLSFILILGCNTKFHAEVLEAGLHSKLSHHSIKNEWFSYNKYTRSWIEKIKKSGLENVTGKFK